MELKYKKSLGQHFLRCSWVAQTMIKAAKIGPDDIVLEIGPGTGILTRAIAKYAKKVVAVEKDERLAEELKKTLQTEHIKNVEVIPGDILKSYEVQPHKIPLKNYKVVANIPYYLTSRLLRVILEKESRPEIIVLTIQKEVAQRIIAKPPNTNLLALSVQAFSAPKIIKTVPAECFYPKPKVESSIILLSDISDKFFQNNKIDQKKFFSILKSAFSQKRKTITNSLTKIAGSKGRAIKIIEKIGLNPSKRPEELSIDNWSEIYKNWP